MLSLISELLGISNQRHRAVAPIADRLDPEAWSPLVIGFEILKASRVTIALHQAEAARRGVDEGADLQLGRIGERTPDALPPPADHQ
jgi:hypothetical protein